MKHRYRPTSRVAWSVLLIAVLISVSTAASAEDIRTRTIHVVPSKQWKATNASTITVLPGTNKSDHKKSEEFTDFMQDWMVKALNKLHYETTDEGGDTTFEYTIDVYDPGNAALRFGVGFGVGKGYARGTLTIKKRGKTVGKYAFSARLRGASTKGLAKEVGPALMLQIHNGDVDTELHEYKKEKDDTDQ